MKLDSYAFMDNRWYYSDLLYKHWITQNDALARHVKDKADDEWEKTHASTLVTAHYQLLLKR